MEARRATLALSARLVAGLTPSQRRALRYRLEGRAIHAAALGRAERAEMRGRVLGRFLWLSTIRLRARPK